MKIRKAFVMSANAGAEEEYEKRHNPIWPELEKVLKDHGVSNYSIFLHPEHANSSAMPKSKARSNGRPSPRRKSVKCGGGT